MTETREAGGEKREGKEEKLEKAYVSRRETLSSSRGTNSLHRWYFSLQRRKQLTSHLRLPLFFLPPFLSPVLVPTHRRKKTRPRAMSNDAGIPSEKMYRSENENPIFLREEIREGKMYVKQNRKKKHATYRVRRKPITVSHGGIVDRGRRRFLVSRGVSSNSQQKACRAI